METLKSETETLSKKEHVCDFCTEKIRIGEKYLSSSHKNDGSVYTWKSHKYCSDLAKRLKMYENCSDDGVTTEDFCEIIKEEFFSILTSPISYDEKIKLSEIIVQLKNVKWHEQLWFVIRHYAKIDKQSL